MFNDWPDMLAVNAENNNMDENRNFPATLKVGLGRSRPEPPVEIAADNSLSQSWFSLQFKKSMLAVNIGRGAFSTGAREKTGPSEQADVVCAPIDPGDSAGHDFFFWFMTGAGNAVPVINSVIDANLDGMGPWLKYLNQEVKVSGITAMIKSVSISELKCIYAGISERQHQRSKWNVSLTLRATGHIEAHFNVPSEHYGPEVDADIKNLSMLVRASFDSTLMKPALIVETLQISMENISLPIPSYYVAGLVNTKFNEEIIGWINTKLQKISLAEFGPSSLPVDSGLSSPSANHDEVPISFKQSDTWMSDRCIQQKLLSHLYLPATHDSAAYALEPTLSQVIWDDEKILEQLSPEKAPPRNEPFAKPYYIGQQAYEKVMTETSLFALTMAPESTIEKQLEDGIRIFDLRIYFDTRLSAFYTHHALRGPALQDILNQILRFCDQRSSSQEFAIFELSHQRWNDNHDPPKVYALI